MMLTYIKKTEGDYIEDKNYCTNSINIISIDDFIIFYDCTKLSYSKW